MWKLAGPALLATAIGVLATPSTADGQAVIARLSRPSEVAFHANTIAWNQFGTPRQGFRLVTDRDVGVRRILPLPGVPRPYEFDLGPGPLPGVNVVYSRCRGIRFRYCDLFVRPAGVGRQRRLTLPDDARWSEVRPAIGRDRVAFLRIRETGRRRGDPLRLHLARLGSRHSTLLPTGPPGKGFSGISGLDIGARGVVLVWTWAEDGRSYERVLLDSTDGRQTILAEDSHASEPGGGTRLSHASISGDVVTWLEHTRASQFEAPDRVTAHSHDLRTGARTSVDLGCRVVSASRSGDELALVQDSSGCENRPGDRYDVVLRPIER